MFLRLILLYGALCAAFVGCGPGPVEVGEVLRPEHPRPDFERGEWLNLNGNWALQPDPEDVGVGKEWFEPGVGFDAAIAVPVASPETEIAWYQREITAPAEWGGRRVWLRLGAASEARVWLNGQAAGEGAGPLELDLGDRLAPGQTATLTVRTSGGGLSETVWLEGRPAHYVRSFSAVTRRSVEGWMLEIAVETGGPGGRLSASVKAGEGAPVFTEDGRVEIPLEGLEAWSPENPKLYPLELTLTGPDGAVDRVQSYFGLRTVERGRYSDSDSESIMLNGSPIYLRGAVDHSGAAATDDDLKDLIESAKSLGFNFLQMANPDPRTLYWADQLGMLVQVDARAGAVERHHNHPSVIVWSGELTVTKLLDPTRLVVDDPPHSITDLNSWRLEPESFDAIPTTVEQLVANSYVGSPANFSGAKNDGAPLLISPFGSAAAEGRELSLEFKHLTNLLRRHKAIQGYVYAGALPQEPGYGAFLRGMIAAELQGADFVGYLGPAIIEARPGQKLELETFVSHFSERNEAPTLEATLVGINDLGGEIRLKGNPRRVRWERYGVTEQPPLPIAAPDIRNYVGAVTLELLDSAGQRIAANYVNIIVRDEGESPRVEFLGPRRLALRLSSGTDRFHIPPQAVAAEITEMELLLEIAAEQPGKVRIQLGGGTVGEIELPGAMSDARGVLSLQQDHYNGSFGSLVRLKIGPLEGASLALSLGSDAGVIPTIHGERDGLYPVDPTLILTTKDAIQP